MIQRRACRSNQCTESTTQFEAMDPQESDGFHRGRLDPWFQRENKYRQSQRPEGHLGRDRGHCEGHCRPADRVLFV